MAIAYTDEQNYIDIANSIRRKNGSTDKYLPSEMAAAIDSINGIGSTSNVYEEFFNECVVDEESHQLNVTTKHNINRILSVVVNGKNVLYLPELGLGRVNEYLDGYSYYIGEYGTFSMVCTFMNYTSNEFDVCHRSEEIMGFADKNVITFDFDTFLNCFYQYPKINIQVTYIG